MSEIRYYLDENMSPEIAEQLRRDGIDAISVRELGTLGDRDEDHLQRAAIMGRVLCTQDADFLRLASERIDHAGIAYGHAYLATIGGWVRVLRQLHANSDAESMIGQVRYMQIHRAQGLRGSER